VAGHEQTSVRVATRCRRRSVVSKMLKINILAVCRMVRIGVILTMRVADV